MTCLPESKGEPLVMNCCAQAPLEHYHDPTPIRVYNDGVLREPSGVPLRELLR